MQRNKCLFRPRSKLCITLAPHYEGKELRDKVQHYRRTTGRAWIYSLLNSLPLDLLAFVAHADALHKKAYQRFGETAIARSEKLAIRRLAVSLYANTQIRECMRMQPDNTLICSLCHMSAQRGGCICTINTVTGHIQKASQEEEQEFKSFLEAESDNPTILLPDVFANYQQLQLEALKQLQAEFQLAYGKGQDTNEDSLCRTVFQLIYSVLKLTVLQELSDPEDPYCELCGGFQLKTKPQPEIAKQHYYCSCVDEDVEDAIDEWIMTSSDSANVIRNLCECQ